jgi:hypothetical protein
MRFSLVAEVAKDCHHHSVKQSQAGEVLVDDFLDFLSLLSHFQLLSSLKDSREPQLVKCDILLVQNIRNLHLYG